MPRSKRDKKISLTKTDKKGLAMKQHIIEDIQSCCVKYDNIFLFSSVNMRNAKLKEVRADWKDSRFFFGKNRVMQLGLQRVIENDEAATIKSLDELSNRLTGQCGLLFTNHDRATVLDWFESYSSVEYAKSGFKATDTVELAAGPMDEFSHAIEPHLRSLGMPTKLEKGVVTLYKDFTVCTKGQVLTPEQAKILKLVARPMAEFKMNIECCWIKDKGFELFIERKSKKQQKKPPKREKKKKRQQTASQPASDEENEKDSDAENSDEAMEED